MKPSAIAMSMPLSGLGGSATKLQSSSSADSETSFGKMLTREMADRKPASDQTAPPPAQEKSVDKQSSPRAEKSEDKSGDDDKSGQSTDTDQTDAQASAEQMLRLAMHLAPPLPVATPVSSALSQTAQDTELTQDTRLAKDSAILLKQPGNTNLGVTIDPGTARTASTPTLTSEENQRPSFNRALNDSAAENITKDLTSNMTGQDLVKSADNLKLAASALPPVNLPAHDTPDVRTDLTTMISPLQHAASNQAQIQSGSTQDRIGTQVGTSGWGQALGQRIVWMIGNAQQSASLTLNPPDLGPLHVVLNVSSTEANASFYAAQPEVRQALENAMPRLREMLSDAGIQLGQANVSADSPQQQASYSQHTSPTLNTVNSTDVSLDAPSILVTRIAKEGLIDTFV